MANRAQNYMKVILMKNNIAEFKKEFEENYDDVEYTWESDEDDEIGGLEIICTSSWTAHTEILESLSYKFNCQIIGVSHEWGCLYVEAFNINK